MTSSRRLFLAACFGLFAIPASATSIYVDNQALPNGDGSQEHPYLTLAAAAQASEAGDEIYVAASTQPYVENIALKPQQKLIGTPTDAVPAIHGMITVSADNSISSLTIANESGTDVYGVSSGNLTLRDVHLRSTNGGFGILLFQQAGAVHVTGGDLEASAGGNGIVITAGAGEVVFERFPIRGSFGSAITISDRIVGAVVFKDDCDIRIDDASKDAAVISNMGVRAPVRFEGTVSIHAHARGLVVFNVPRLTFGSAASTIATINATALDVRNSAADITLATISAEGSSPGGLREGIVLEGAGGMISIGSTKGSGGSIRNASAQGVLIDSSRNVHLAGITISTSGSFDGSKDAHRAALVLHNVEASTFEDLTIEGGSNGVLAVGSANVTFSRLTVRGAAGPGVLLQDAGDIRFFGAALSDNGGSELAIQQRSTSGRVVLDRCILSAAGKPTAATHLLDASALDHGKLELVVEGGEMNDNAGSAIEAHASDDASLSIAMDGASAARLGTGALMVAALGASRVSVDVQASTLSAPAAPAVIDVNAADHGGACVKIAGNELRGPVAIHLAATARGSLRLVGASDATTLAATNGGAVVKIDAPAGVVTSTASCE